MADYYAILKKAVGSLDPGPAEARRAVYDRARKVVTGQFKATDRSLARSEISRQRLALEEAIRRVELETVAEGQDAARHMQPAQAVPTAGIVQDPVPPLPSGTLSPRDIFRLAVQKAEARAAATGYSTERASERPTSRYKDDATVASPGDWAQGGRRENQTETNNSSAVARLASEDDWRLCGGTMSPSPESYHDGRLSRVSTTGQGRQEYLEDKPNPQALEWPVPRSRWPTTLLFGLMVGAIVGLGLLAWSQ